MKFKVILVFLRNRIIAEIRSENITADRTCGIAVAPPVRHPRNLLMFRITGLLISKKELHIFYVIILYQTI